MKYTLVKHNGKVKDFERLPRSIDPRDVLIEMSTYKVVNRSLMLIEGGLKENYHHIRAKERAIKKLKGVEPG